MLLPGHIEHIDFVYGILAEPSVVWRFIISFSFSFLFYLQIFVTSGLKQRTIFSVVIISVWLEKKVYEGQNEKFTRFSGYKPWQLLKQQQIVLFCTTNLNLSKRKKIYSDLPLESSIFLFFLLFFEIKYSGESLPIFYTHTRLETGTDVSDQFKQKEREDLERSTRRFLLFR